MAVDDRIPDLRRKSISGLLWRSLERFGIQGTDLIVSIVLARLLGPEPYGLVALLAVFLSLSRILLDCGFGKSLIQRKTLANDDCSTVFVVNLVLGVVFYSLLFLAAPSIAHFYGRPELSLILRIAAIGLLFNAVNDVQHSLLVRKMDFKLAFRVSMSQTIVKGVLGVYLAFAGFGVWSLVWAPLAGRFVGTIVLWRSVAWRPSLRFSFASFRSLFSYGWKLALSSLLGSLTGNLSNLLIGRMYTARDLAFYRKGQSFPNAFVAVVNGPVSSVSFTALAKLQSDIDRFRSAVRKMLSSLAFLVAPAMGFLAGTAPAFIRLVLGAEWTPSIPFVQLACFSCAFGPLSIANTQAIMSYGRSGTALKLETVKKVLAITVVLAVLPYGVMPFAIVSAFVSTPLSTLLNVYPNRRILRYGFRNQFLDVAPSLAFAFLIFCIETVLWRLLSSWHPSLVFALQSVVGLGLFLAVAVSLRPQGWIVTLELLKPLRGALRSLMGGVHRFGRKPSKGMDPPDEAG